ncbi:hypothetical protein [Jatrophihabitans endophyticus]|uniref:hypothetical protein n=1 Tax=Jatrophihabitans endophyticus TaxID=1206085 RepID=UPI0019E61436|nr:hypothetical protein [Jatrophihabitans endophyticus]MBE7189009.1 hypothetical protein [Jatrophihabitans endophyticus]
MPDEDLPQPAPRSARTTRLLTAAAAVVVLAVVALAVVRVTTSSSPQAGPPTVTVAPSAPTQPATTPPRRAGLPAASTPPDVLHPLRHLTSAAIDAAHRRCPRLAPTCTTTGETPAAVAAALHAAYPRAGRPVAVSDIAYDDGSGPRLAFREVSARAGRLTIVVEARARAAGDGVAGHEDDDGPHHVARRETVVGRLTVEVQVSGPASRYLDEGRVARLLADRRLLATG